MTEDRIAIVCVRIADVPTPSAQSMPDHCVTCKAPVWVSFSTLTDALERAGSQHTVVFYCGQCGLAAIQREPEAEVMPIGRHTREALRKAMTDG